MRRLWPGLCLIYLVGCASGDERWGDYAPPIDAGDSADARAESDVMLRTPDGAPEPDAAPDVAPPVTDAGPPVPDMVPPDPDMAPPEPDMAPPDPDMAPLGPDMAPPDPDMAPPDPDMAPPDPDMAPPDPDMALPLVCAEGDRRDVACGLNGRGLQPQRCAMDAWIDDGPCVDPDRCVDGTAEQEPCGLNDRGTRRRVCVAGDFRPPEACVDPDECVDGTAEQRACGARDDGLQGRACAAGEWLDWGPCVGACVDECAPGETACVADGLAACGDTDDDPCLEFDPPTPCAPGVACVDGACADPPVGGVIINEVFYDEDGGDGPGVFIELWGPPGASVEGMALIGINGANGVEFADIALVGAIGADGYYLVVHPDATPDLAALAELVDAQTDLQNGPDNLQLVGPDGVLDALTYGNVGAHFFGETAGAADVPPGTALTRIEHRDTDDNSVDFVPRAPSPRAEPAE